MCCKEQLQLGETLDLTINSMNERTDNDEACVFTNIPINKKSEQRIFLGSKQSTMRNFPLPENQRDNDLSG